MPVVRLLREQTVGEVRWAALSGRGEPVSLYLERASDAQRAVIGERFDARVRRADAVLGGAFLDLGPKGEAFLRLKSCETVTEGAALGVEVAAEARRGKLARVRITDADAPPLTGAARWRTCLTGGADAIVDERPAGDPEVRAAFEEVLVSSVTLGGGGRLRAERTEALIAADIDTAGRTSRGGRAANALAINLEAAAELARQIHLRGWGGLAVLDCVAPVDKVGGARIRTAFLDAFRTVSTRQVKALAPSAFGLMEVSADWQVTPLSERLADTAPETLALEGLRQLEAAARADRMARIGLILPEAAFAWLSVSGLDPARRLAETYGGRLTIGPGRVETADVMVLP